MDLSKLNDLPVEQAHHQFMQCCTAERWVEQMVAARPFSSGEKLREVADEIWQQCTEADFLQAFDGHPKIGDVSSLRAKYANTKALASGEQSAVSAASEDTLQALAQGNTDYQEKFGFIFIVCATGKSAEQMLGLLQARLPNDRDTELKNAAQEQRKIFHIRIDKLL